MSKHSKTDKTTNIWNKLMMSNILPTLWGMLLVIIITATLLSLGILAVRWLLTLVGVIV